MFPELVVKEAEALRKHATLEELQKLDFKLLQPQSRFGCIYGQMTGNCFSDRASELIVNCCDKVFSTEGFDVEDPYPDEADSLIDIVDGGRRMGKVKYFSPIEVFIADKHRTEEKKVLNKKLIEYLRGEVENLN